MHRTLCSEGCIHGIPLVAGLVFGYMTQTRHIQCICMKFALLVRYSHENLHSYLGCSDFHKFTEYSIRQSVFIKIMNYLYDYLNLNLYSEKC